MSIAYIGIGSNIGDRSGNCRRAVQLLRENGLGVTKVSSFIETEPWGFKEQPLFINAAAEVETSLTPHELLRLLKAIELDMGRVASGGWGPRIIDLDILLFDDQVINDQELVIPHPFVPERDFALRPLAEIAPSLLHPRLNLTIEELLRMVREE
jgi:dihydroneopterin aldolase / 2-amino-4-hydroxy-6-hydroxymethyldihydropteridine diphosphokinase